MSLPQATVSQQLARLRLDDLVSTRRSGRLIYYRIADTGISNIVEFLYEVFCKPSPENTLEIKDSLSSYRRETID
ncbi:MAG: DNA-binding transcriptional ArsR family regulator [Granulosicoccus sp.]|jgi:DNA-binding transcriptional ArsR family regulator